MEVLEVRYEGVHKEGHHLHQREERAPIWERTGSYFCRLWLGRVVGGGSGLGGHTYIFMVRGWVHYRQGIFYSILLLGQVEGEVASVLYQGLLP